MATLNELFPGQAGRLQLIRVMLSLRMPQLQRTPRDEELDKDTERKLRDALQRVQRG
jgi:hypothetical protein